MGEDDADLEREKIAQQAEDRTARRYREARDSGWTRDDSRAFASSDLDIGQLRELHEAGCDPVIAARIML